MDQGQWDKFIQSQHGSFLQSWQWGEFQKAYGRTVRRYQYTSGAVQIIVYALKHKLAYLFAPYGPVGNFTKNDLANFLYDIKLFAKHQQAIFFRYERLAKQIKGRSVKDIHPKYTWITTLVEPVIMLKSFKQKWRYNIHLAEKKQVQVRVSNNIADVPAVYALLKNTATRQHIKIHPQAYYEMMVQTLGGTGLLKLYLAEYNNKLCAAHIMIGYGDTMTYLHGGTDYAQRAIMAPHLLQWQAMIDAYKNGFKFYDWFGIAPQISEISTQSVHPWAGLTRFKQGFGGKAITYTGTYELPLKKMWYTTYRLVNYLH